MPDFGSEVMAEALAQRALVKPVYTIPIIPLSNSNQYRHQDHLDMKDYKKVSRNGRRTEDAQSSGAVLNFDFVPREEVRTGDFTRPPLRRLFVGTNISLLHIFLVQKD